MTFYLAAACACRKDAPVLFLERLSTMRRNSLLMWSSIHVCHLKNGMFRVVARLYSYIVSIVQTAFMWGLLSLTAWHVSVKNSCIGSRFLR